MKKVLSLIMVILLVLIVPNAAKTTLIGKVGETVGRLFEGLFPKYGKPADPHYSPNGGAYPPYRPLAGGPHPAIPQGPVNENKKQF